LLRTQSRSNSFGAIGGERPRRAAGAWSASRANLRFVDDFIRDARWDLIDKFGTMVEGTPVDSVGDLRRFADKCAALLDDWPPDGACDLLRVARSLFVHAWLDVDFFMVCANVSLQAIETVVRQMYPLDTKVPLAALVKRVEEANLLPPEILEVMRNGVEIRNQLSHPLGVATFKPSIASSILIVAHRFVASLGHHAA